MASTSLRTLREVLTDQLSDAEVRTEWGMRAPARVIALRLVKFRAEHRISQTQLGRMLGMSQPAVARLESGEHVPTLPSLLRIADALDIEILVDIRPASRGQSWVAGATEIAASTAERVTMTTGQELLVAAS